MQPLSKNIGMFSSTAKVAIVKPVMSYDSCWYISSLKMVVLFHALLCIVQVWKYSFKVLIIHVFKCVLVIIASVFIICLFGYVVIDCRFLRRVFQASWSVMLIMSIICYVYFICGLKSLLVFAKREDLIDEQQLNVRELKFSDLPR